LSLLFEHGLMGILTFSYQYQTEVSLSSRLTGRNKRDSPRCHQ
jgi:hypothetical protein